MLLNDILAQLALRGEGAAVNDAERIILLVVRQGVFPTDNFAFSLAWLASTSRRNAL
jgi:Zn-dependent membrane protease YugP